MKRSISAAAIIVALAFVPLFAQQMTRIAVVDLNRLYLSYYRDSQQVRDLNDLQSQTQATIDSMTQEIKQLQSQGVDVTKKIDALKEYYNTNNAKIADLRSKLVFSTDFLQIVYTEIKAAAEADGYSIVLNVNEDSKIIWYSPSVDITDEVLQTLQTKYGQGKQ